MKGIVRSLLRFACVLLGAALLAGASQAQTAASQPGPSAARSQATFVDFMSQLARRGLVAPNTAPSKAPILEKPSMEGLSVSTQTFAGSEGDPAATLPVWNFNARSSRDHRHHPGTMVGTSPFNNPASTTVTTYIVPLIIKTHMVATSFDPATGTLGTVPGDVTSDPTDAQSTCLTAPNNVPLTLLQQSPLFTPTPFTFGAVNVGTTQYIDAFQRGNFWNILGPAGQSSYHVLLAPTVLEPIEINVPDNEGLALSPALFGLCAPLQIIDFNWIDAYLNGTVLPRITEHGVNPGNLPLYFAYNVVEAAPVTNLFTCCILGYHSVTGHPIPNQTYAIGDFEYTGAFPPTIDDSAVLSHELGEWVNDPYTVNEVAPWGGTGQVAGCSNSLEVGDPLTGTEIPQVLGANGFTYDLQELVYFSWFIGAPATGTNGWFSDNGTFLTDAGPPCP